MEPKCNALNPPFLPPYFVYTESHVSRQSQMNREHNSTMISRHAQQTVFAIGFSVVPRAACVWFAFVASPNLKR